MRGADVVLSRLHRLAALRRARRLEPDRDARLRRLTAWQGRRLARTYAGLLENPRYRPAVRFFLDDLYAPRDFNRRDRDLRSISPVLARLLPETALHTMGLALEMNVLTEELDAATEKALGGIGSPGPALPEEVYAEAYRLAGEAAKRRRQIELIREVGEDLDRIVGRPWVKRALQVARRPARAAGLDGLHDLLERGREAFARMRGAAEFLDAICGRELEIMARLYDRHPEPFALGS